MLEGEKMSKYIARMKNVLRELKEVGQHIPETRWTNCLLNGLPQKYSVLKATLRHYTMTGDKCTTTLEEEEAILLCEEAEDTPKRTKERSLSPCSCLPPTRNRSYNATNIGGRRCYACGDTNHLVADCFHVHSDRRPQYLPPPRSRPITSSYNDPANSNIHLQRANYIQAACVAQATESDDFGYPMQDCPPPDPSYFLMIAFYSGSSEVKLPVVLAITILPAARTCIALRPSAPFGS